MSKSLANGTAPEKIINQYGADILRLWVASSDYHSDVRISFEYLKQLSEGYEDAQRFEIMQKVGMTKQEIRRSINSQLLTVFFLPLIFAGLHLAFAFPFIRKILYMFSFYNTSFLVWTTVISFFVFAVLYALVYKKTSNTYYKIVS